MVRDVCPICETAEAKPYDFKFSIEGIEYQAKSIKCTKCGRIYISSEEFEKIISEIVKTPITLKH